MPAFLVKSRQAWLAQAKDALERLEADRLVVDGVTATPIDHALRVNPRAVADLLQAFNALGVPIDPALLDRSGLRPVAAEILEIGLG